MTPDPALGRALADDRPLFVPPLDIAVNVAQQALADALAAQFRAQLNPAVAGYQLGALTEALRCLLAAVTAELYGPPDEEREERIPGQRPPSPGSATEVAA